MATALVTQIAYAVQTLFDPAGTAGRLVDLGKLANYGLLTSFTPAALFTTGVNGAWYDPSDFSTMFQAAAGTTPVTAVGQPVGLMLDKSKGLVLGSERITNGDFSSSANWTPDAGWTISGGVATKTSGASAASITQSLSLTGGVVYLVQYTVSAISGSGVFPRLLGSTTVDGIVRTTAGTFTEYITAPAGMTAFAIRGQSTASATIGNISVRELPGNHAYNPSGNSANFPVLSARYNLLTKTEDFSDAAWEKGANVVVTQNTLEVLAPDGAYTASKLNSPSTVGTAFVRQVFTVPLVAHTGRVWVRKGNYRYFGLRVVNNDSGPGDYVVLDFDANSGNGGIAFIPPTENVSYTFSKTGDWFELSVTNLPNATIRYFQIGISDALGLESPIVPANSFVYVWHPDLRVSNDALNQPAYQRVTTSTDYDTVGFKPYLSFNGVNQWLQTNSIDFTYGDKMFVSAGVRKLSDAAVGMITELSVNLNTNNGTFSFYAPHAIGQGSYFVASKGTSAVSITNYAGSAPHTCVATFVGDISGSWANLRVNGDSQAITVAQGAGNFGNYPMFIGTRGGSSLFFNGRLYGLVVAGKAASASEISSTEAWLNQKTGAY